MYEEGDVVGVKAVSSQRNQRPQRMMRADKSVKDIHVCFFEVFRDVHLRTSDRSFFKYEANANDIVDHAGGHRLGVTSHHPMTRDSLIATNWTMPLE